MNRKELLKNIEGIALLVKDRWEKEVGHIIEQIECVKECIEKIKDEPEVEKWKPKRDELCWFSAKEDFSIKVVDHFTSMNGMLFGSQDGGVWEYCKPYNKTHLHWIKNTGEIPKGKICHVKYRNENHGAGIVHDFGWELIDESCDIIEYCIIEE